VLRLCGLVSVFIVISFCWLMRSLGVSSIVFMVMCWIIIVRLVLIWW